MATERGLGQEEEQALTDLLEFIRENRGFDLSAYKPASLIRRLRKRMDAVGIETFDAYRDFLETHPGEFAPLFDTLLINVTSFFRDPESWDYLATEVLPPILEAKGPDDSIRAWSAGCASGEEAYTLAIVLAEAVGADAFRRRVKIYATDVDEDALASARQAVYTAKEIEPVSDELKEKYFKDTGTRFSFRNDLRRAIIFGHNDILEDPPMSRLDLLVCRNTLMYFNAQAQGSVLRRFHFALNSDGALFLGKAEMLLTHADLFSPVDLPRRIFRKVPLTTPRDRVPVDAVSDELGSAAQIGQLVHLRDAAFERSPLAQVVVDAEGTLVMVNGRARTTFGVDTRDVGRAFHDLEISYRPVEVRSLIEDAYEQKKTVHAADVPLHRKGAREQHFHLTVEPVFDPPATPLGCILVFDDVTEHLALEVEFERSKQELETAYEELQSTNEELETTNEELQSTVEELETTNEELQSTNEELETMNEELHSTNAELAAASVEVNQRSQEAEQANKFLEAVLGSLPPGIVVLDQELGVVVWNENTEQLWGLRADEVKGQSFISLDIGLPVEELARPIRACLSESSSREEVELDATNRTGKAVRCRVVCAPMNSDDGPLGVVLSMTTSDR